MDVMLFIPLLPSPPSTLIPGGNLSHLILAERGTSKPAEVERVIRGGISFYQWTFNDVDVSVTRDAGNRLYFFLSDQLNLRGGPTAARLNTRATTNVWAHGTSALTSLPRPTIPQATAPPQNNIVARVQIVWPHDVRGRAAPVSDADLANVTVALFVGRSAVSVPPQFEPLAPLVLLAGINNGSLKAVAAGPKKRLVTTEGGLVYPVWDFNDVDVSAARDRANKILLHVPVSGFNGEASNIWAHGADGRTYFPQTDVPEKGCP